MLLHWVTMVLVLVLFGLGWYMVELPQGPDRSRAFALHKSIGLTVLLLTLIRIGWRITHKPPPLPASIGGWRIALAHAVHYAFYVLLLVQPLSGYISSSFSGYRTRYFGIPLPHWGHENPPLNELFTEIHVISSVGLLSLIVVHVLGALAHIVTPGDRLFRRMVPW